MLTVQAALRTTMEYGYHFPRALFLSPAKNLFYFTGKVVSGILYRYIRSAEAKQSIVRC